VSLLAVNEKAIAELGLAEKLNTARKASEMLGFAELEDVQERTGEGGPVMIDALRGFVDAGRLSEIVSDFLLREFEATRVATFNPDEVFDYSVSRPMAMFDVDKWTDYEPPFLAIDYLLDENGTGFFLLHGAEPNLKWQAIVDSLMEFNSRFGVGNVLHFHGIPMAVPHTRALGFTAHATRAGLIDEFSSFHGTVGVPAGVPQLLEIRRGELGLDAQGFAIHIPQYLSGMPYPTAAAFALNQLEDVTGLKLKSAVLEELSRELTTTINSQLSENEQIARTVEMMEERYDEFTGQFGTPGRMPQSSDGKPLPTADEIAAEFEKFLENQG
jgi:hypothetical protein